MEAVIAIKELADAFDRWFTHIAAQIEQRRIRVTGSCGFPAVLRVAESPTHFVAELSGVQRGRSGRVHRLHRPRAPERIRNTSAFLNPGFDVDGNEEAVMRLKAKHWHLQDLSLCTAYDQEILSKKLATSPRPVELSYREAQVPLIIDSRCDFCVFRNIDLVRTDAWRVTFRTISTALAFRTHHTRRTLRRWLDSLLRLDPKSPNLFGVNLGIDNSSEQLARELQSLADQDISEPIIDGFLEAHSRDFAEALGYRAALPKKKLRWIQREETDPEQSIPDYLMLRKDGYCDILDLKRAALRCRSITTGRRGRERFTAYVTDLIAQLNGYRRYFGYEKNRKWALSECGVEVNDPMLIGVVGNHDNFRRADVDIALESYKDHIVVLSYADVINFFRHRVRSGDDDGPSVGSVAGQS